MVELQPFATYHGPNPFATDPVVVVEMSGSDDALLRLAHTIPALQAATADWYRPGEAASDQTPAQQVGHFLADWAVQALTFAAGYLHAAGCVIDPSSGQTLVWVGFHDPQTSLSALNLGARWLSAAANGHPDDADFPAMLHELWALCHQRHPDYQARIVMEAARARGVPYAPALGLSRMWRFGQGHRSRALFESSPCDDSRIGAWVAESKSLTKGTLQSLGIPVPAFQLVEHESELEQAAATIGFPCVTKPIDQGCGRGVSGRITNLDALRDGFAAARAFTKGPVLVEAHVEGEDHRLMVVDGRLVAAIRREPPSVTGDGRRTIAELVAEKNARRDGRSLVRSGYLRPIALDASACVHLQGLGMSPESILDEGCTVRVRSNANLSTGGDCTDVTDQVHPDIRVMAETIACTLNQAVLGADFLSTNIGIKPEESGGGFIEINGTPGLCVLIAAGWPVERAGALALRDAPGRIPLHLFVVAEQNAESALAAARGCHWPIGAGWASWEQGHNAGARLSVVSDAAWAGAQALLGHRTLGRAVIIATDRQIYESGLPQETFDSAHLACELDPKWLEVLRRHCADVTHYDHGRGDSGTWLPAVLDAVVRTV